MQEQDTSPIVTPLWSSVVLVVLVKTPSYYASLCLTSGSVPAAYDKPLLVSLDEALPDSLQAIRYLSPEGTTHQRVRVLEVMTAEYTLDLNDVKEIVHLIEVLLQLQVL